MSKRYPNTILATACIPWDEQYMFSESIFKRTLDLMLAQGLDHIYLFGTAGEGYAVTEQQFGQISTCFARFMLEQKARPMIGLISLSLPSMQERLRFAYDLGVRDFMFALPAWGALADDELISFFQLLCDPYPDCSFLHYNNPRSKRVLTIQEYAQLSERIPNLAGAKYSTSDPQILRQMAELDCGLQFFITENGFATGSLLGEFALLLSVASSNIKRARQFYQAGLTRDKDTLQGMQLELARMVENLIRVVGSRIDGAYDKIFSRLINPDFPLRLLPPYYGATEAACQEYLTFLQIELPDWLA